MRTQGLKMILSSPHLVGAEGPYRLRAVIQALDDPAPSYEGRTLEPVRDESLAVMQIGAFAG
jgi:hypothetical protein